MSALGQKRTNLGEPKSDFVRFGPIADIRSSGWNVCFVRIADIAGLIRSPHLRRASNVGDTVRSSLRRDNVDWN